MGRGVVPGNMYALSGCHCGPYSSSIKQSILNWHDRLLNIDNKKNGARITRTKVIRMTSAMTKEMVLVIIPLTVNIKKMRRSSRTVL